MSTDRWVVLGVAGPRASWFHELSRSAHGAAVPIEFVKCISMTEVRSRLTSGRRFSALVVGDDALGLDRDVIAECTARRVAVLVVATGVAPRDWRDLGVADVLPHDFDREAILGSLATHSTPVSDLAARPATPIDPGPDQHRGRLVAVTGIGGAGTSTLAMSLAQRFGSEPSHTAMVLLADLALDADQAMLHHAGDITPAIQELVEACGRSVLDRDELRRHVFDVHDRGYHLLLGLRHHRDWTALRAHAYRTALDGLRRAYRVVIADTDADLEGQSETGSLDIEDRNLMARHTLTTADVRVVVGHPGTKGLYALHRVLCRLTDAGCDPSTIIPVINRAPKRPRRRAGETAALAALCRERQTGSETTVGNPVFESAHRGLESAIRDGIEVPDIGHRLHLEVSRALEAVGPSDSFEAEEHPVPIAPGSLGSWKGDVA